MIISTDAESNWQNPTSLYDKNTKQTRNRIELLKPEKRCLGKTHVNIILSGQRQWFFLR